MSTTPLNPLCTSGGIQLPAGAPQTNLARLNPLPAGFTRAPRPRLSLRQRQVAFLWVMGYSYKQISAILDLGTETIKVVLTHIRRKYGIEHGSSSQMREDLWLFVVGR